MGISLRVVLLVVTLVSIGMQLRTVRRVGTAGLAASTWFALVTSTMFWLGYGVATSESTLISINLPVLAIGLTLALAIIRSGAASARSFIPYVAIPALGWAVAAATGAAWVLGVGGTVLVVGRLIPQLVTAVRATDRSGISVGAWIGNGSNKIVWAVYGFVIGDAFVAWPAVVASIVSFTVVAIVRSGSGRPPRPRRSRPTVRRVAPQPA